MAEKPLDLKNIFADLKVQAAEAGISLSELCREAQVNRSTIEQWKESPPQVFAIVVRLAAVLNTRRAAKELA